MTGDMFDSEKRYEFWCVGEVASYKGNVALVVSASNGVPIAVHLSTGTVLNWANVVSYKAAA